MKGIFDRYTKNTREVVVGGPLAPPIIRPRKLTSQEETARWLVEIKSCYPNHYNRCKAEIDSYRADPVCYKMNAEERLKGFYGKA
jgi:hypothetical protein